MNLGLSSTVMEALIRDSILMALDKAMEFRLILMETFMKGPGIIMRDMEKEDLSIFQVIFNLLNILKIIFS
jgi:hypothetical protein